MARLLDILLQRNNADFPWGFRIKGGLNSGRPPIISSVTFGTLASQYLNAGDKILEIEKRKGVTLSQWEIDDLLQNGGPTLHLLVEKLPSSGRAVPNGVPNILAAPSKPLGLCEMATEHEWIREKRKSFDGKKQSTKIWLRESNRIPSLGEYDIEVNFERTKYREKGEPDDTRKRVQSMSENFDKVFKEKIGEWLGANMLNGVQGKQQGASPAGDGTHGAQPPPPPPPGFPGALPGRRIKTEVPERGLEPPSVIQNAMMTKDKKPFTYTPGGIDLSEIRSPKMARRLNRNACAEEMPGLPAPTTNQNPSAAPPTNSHFSAMQSQLPAQVLPPVGAAPPPPPPPSETGALPSSPASTLPSVPASKLTGRRPPLGFDPNELLARVNKAQTYVPSPGREEPVPRNFRTQPAEEKPVFEPKQQKPNEIGQNIHVPLQNEPGHIYVPEVAPKTSNDPSGVYAAPPSNHQARGQLGSIYIPPVATQEQNAPSPSSPFEFKMQQNSPSVASPPVENKPQAPWVTVYRTPQSSVPWAGRDHESPKPAGTRIIPIKIEGRDSPKPTTPSPQPQPTPPPFLQNQQMRQMQQQQPIRQQAPAQQQPLNTRVIPIQIEGSSQSNAKQQTKSQCQGYAQNKFNPMTPQSPTPFSPSQDKDQKPQWASVQPRPFKKEHEVIQQRTNDVSRPQQPQPEYSTYNTAGVPLSQLRKMQLNDDDRVLMDKFKSQVERQGNEILNDENSNPRYRGGYIPSRVFKALDESVDDEKYLHSESDPRYRGACIPSRAFRMLQCMTDTAGDNPQQVPKSPVRGPPSRPLSGAQFQQESGTPGMGPYVPPSEQQAQEPRKYTGGSIPSRSFRMLQAMTGQEVSAPSGPPSGRETPVLGVNRWCLSPSPSPIDSFWGFYLPDPYLIYNYISDLNAAYGFPPPPPPPSFAPTPPFHATYYHTYQNYSSDSDEFGYSSTDELAQYYANYRTTFGYSPYSSNQDGYSTQNPFNAPRVCVTPVQGSKKKEVPKVGGKIYRSKSQNEEKVEATVQNGICAEEEMFSSTEDESESDTEVEEEERNQSSSLQTLKSVPDLNVYTSKDTSAGDKDENGESSEEEAEMKEEPVPHQLSVIFEESEQSDADRGAGRSSTVSESESCSTLDKEDDESDNDGIDAESSVTVRLPLKFKFSRTDNDEDITTVIVGDSRVERHALYDLNMVKESEQLEKTYDSDEADVSVTFTLPTRSNSEHSHSDSKEEELPKDDVKETILEQPENEVTVRISVSRSPENKSAVVCESPLAEDDSSSTSVQSGDTVLKHKEDTDEDSENEEKPKLQTFKLWLEKETSKDCNETNKTEETEEKENAVLEDDSYKAGVGKLEEMISSLLETTRDTMSSSMEISEKDFHLAKKPDESVTLMKKDSQEESEEDDSGVTSDMSIKQMNSETDADTESDYSELSKMTKFQRASTHSRLFKLLQEECERCGNETRDEDGSTFGADQKENISDRKQKLTLSLNPMFSNEVESLSSSSGIASPSSPTISDRLVKELIHNLLNKKKGKKFRKLPLAKLHAAALKILQEEMDSYDTSPTSGDDVLYLSPVQKKRLHSKLTAKFVSRDGTEPECLEPVPESIYGENYHDYLDYYDTWGDPDDRDIVPSRAFRMLREHTLSPRPVERCKARCPRVASKKNLRGDSPSAGRKTPVFLLREPPPDYLDEPCHESMTVTVAQKQEKASKVLEKSVKC